MTTRKDIEQVLWNVVQRYINSLPDFRIVPVSVKEVKCGLCVHREAFPAHGPFPPANMQETQLLKNLADEKERYYTAVIDHAQKNMRRKTTLILCPISASFRLA